MPAGLAGSISGRQVPTDQMLISKAQVEENAEAFTAVASSPAVNSLRISRSRSIQGGRSKWTGQKLPSLSDHGGGDESDLGNEDARGLADFSLRSPDSHRRRWRPPRAIYP